MMLAILQTNERPFHASGNGNRGAPSGHRPVIHQIDLRRMDLTLTWDEGDVNTARRKIEIATIYTGTETLALGKDAI